MNRSSLPPRHRRRAGILLAVAMLAVVPSAFAVDGRTRGLARAMDAAWQRAAEARRAEGEALAGPIDRLALL